MQAEIHKNMRFNYLMNVFDGAFFGFGIGFASFSTVIPLFISTMTDSAVLIGLVMAIHSLGWQLPQLWMARYIVRINKYKPLVAVLTIHERVPFIGLALTALLVPAIGTTAALILAFLMLAWQGLGAGITANPWQVMIHKVIPADYLATFFGVQGAAANFLASGAAVIAGIILNRVQYPENYAIVFGIACMWLFLSWFFLNATREPEHTIDDNPSSRLSIWKVAISILREDKNFFWLLISRILSQFGMMGFAFYAVHVVRNLGASEVQAGIMASTLMITQVVMNIFLGWLADRWSRLRVLELGFIAMAASAAVAFPAPNYDWFYLVMILTGIAYTALWTIMIAFTLQFGTDQSRPTYVGMANTLIAPFTILAPLLGGWLANLTSYQTVFAVSFGFGLVSILALHFLVKDPRKTIRRIHPNSPIAVPENQKADDPS